MSSKKNKPKCVCESSYPLWKKGKRKKGFTFAKIQKAVKKAVEKGLESDIIMPIVFPNAAGITEEEFKNVKRKDSKTTE